MEKDNNRVYEEIREILEKNRDAHKGFARAAENTTGLAVRRYFERKSPDRNNFNDKLLMEIMTGYPDMDVAGSFTGTLHRAWMDVKLLLTGANDESIWRRQFAAARRQLKNTTTF